MGKKKDTPQEGRELILKAGKMITNRIPIALGLEKTHYRGSRILGTRYAFDR